MDRVRQPPVGSEQAALEPFKRSPASGNQVNQRDPVERPSFSLAKQIT